MRFKARTGSTGVGGKIFASLFSLVFAGAGLFASAPAAGATLADVDGNGITAADRIRSQALRDALAGT